MARRPAWPTSDVAQAVALGILLVGVRIVGAVVAGVAQAVTIVVFLAGVGNRWAAINGIGDAVPVRINFLWKPDDYLRELPERTLSFTLLLLCYLSLTACIIP